MRTDNINNIGNIDNMGYFYKMNRRITDTQGQ